MPADENTLLLIHGDTDIVDVSPSGHPLTAHGYAQASPAKYKFGDGSLWIPGSLNSIGSTDALSNLLAGSTWTIDFWFRYPTVVIGGHQIVGQVNPVNRLGWYVTYTPDVGDGLTGSFSFNMFDSMDSNSGQWLYFYSESCYLAPDTWAHFAIVRDGSDLYMFMNGVSISLVTSTNTLTTGVLISQPVRLGGFTGYGSGFFLDEFRLSTVARWTANFTPPSTAHSTDSDTRLLFHFEGDDHGTVITDSSSNDQGMMTIGAAWTSTDTSKFGGSCFWSDPTYDHVSAPDSPDWDFMSGDWTIDFWLNWSYDGIGSGRILEQWYDGTTGNVPPAGWQLVVNVERNGLLFSCFEDGQQTVYVDAEGLGMVVDTWKHIAIVNASGVLTVYADGWPMSKENRYSINSYVGTPENTLPLLIGKGLFACIDELRISNMARWTEHFSPPTEAYSGNFVTDSVDDSMDISDDNSTTCSPSNSVSDQIVAEDTGIATLTGSKSVSDSMGLSDSAYTTFLTEVQSELDLDDTTGATLCLLVRSYLDIVVENLSGATIYPKVNDVVSMSDNTKLILGISIVDAFALADSSVGSLCLSILDMLGFSELIETLGHLVGMVADPIGISDETKPILGISANDSVGVSDNVSPILCIEGLDQLGFSELVLAAGRLGKAVDDSIDAVDATNIGYVMIVSDIVNAIDVSAVIGSLLQSASSGLTMDDSVASRLRMGHDITEVITLVDDVSSNGVLYSTVYDGIALNIEVELNGEIWECYVLNTPKMYPSVYSGFDFNSYCVFNGRSYGCRGDGVYELTGDTDNGSDIHSGVQLPMTKFDMPHQKRFRKAYVVASGAAPLMIMEAEDGTKKVYSIDSEGEVDTSRTKSRKWKLTITDFESLDAMRLIPIVLSR